MLDLLRRMDNLGAHKVERAKEAFRRAGIEFRYLPPYSPDFNPIELAWSKVVPLVSFPS